MDFVTLDSTHYDAFNETIPFYHIAIHGLVGYTGQVSNLISESQRVFLRQIEYGAQPAYILTHESSSLLFRTGANQVYSSRYDYWRDEVVRQYKAMESLEALIAQFIIGHEQLSDGVYQTTYEDGTRVIVNYNEMPYAGNSFSVPPLDFLVIGGN